MLTEETLMMIFVIFNGTQELFHFILTAPGGTVVTKYSTNQRCRNYGRVPGSVITHCCR